MRDTSVRKEKGKKGKKEKSGVVEKFDGRKEAGLRPRDFWTCGEPLHLYLSLLSPSPFFPRNLVTLWTLIPTCSAMIE